MSLTQDEKEQLLFASPCEEFLETIKTLSPNEKKELFVLAKYKALPLGRYFFEQLHYGDGPKAGIYAHDLAERALLLYEDPISFHELGEIMASTTAILPNCSTDTFKNNGLSYPSMGVVGLASDMVRTVYSKYISCSHSIGTNKMIKNVLGAVICLIVLGLFMFHPFFTTLFAGEWVNQMFKFLGAIICIILLFTTGFAGAGVFLVVYAFIMSTLEKFFPLSVLVKLVAYMIPVGICVYLLYKTYKIFIRRKHYLKAKKESKRYINDAKICLAYFEECLKKAEIFNVWQEKEGLDENIDSVVKYYQKAVKELKIIINTFSN